MALAEDQLTIAVVARDGRTIAALLRDDQEIAYAVDDPDRPDLTGAIYAGRLQSFEQKLGGWFVDLNTSRPGLLPSSQIPPDLREGLHAGRRLAVKVTGNAREGKGVKLSARAVDTFHEPARGSATGDEIVRATAVDRLAQLVKPGVSVGIAFESETLRSLAGMTANSARLFRPSDSWRDWVGASLVEKVHPDESFEGGVLSIELTRAGWMVDIDLSPKAERVEALCSAMTALGAAVHLRNLSGLIVIDVPHIEGKMAKAQVTSALDQALDLHADLVSFPHWQRSALDGFGTIRLTRQRRWRSLTEQLLTRAKAPESGWRMTEKLK